MADQSISDFMSGIKKSFESIGQLNTYVTAFSTLGAQATNLNQAFTQNRTRIVEMQQSIADSIPAITRLGGSVTDVTNTISEIALASNRNVIANTETVEKLFAAGKVLGMNATYLTEQFANMGVTFEKIPKLLEESISYVQSIGGNAKEVMEDVVRNTDKLNRFNFEGGVKGLTKMAAQASMLRVDMGESLKLADDVLNPDKAVEVASAFQRLGVAAGNLVDPFQLMNQSINDPSGLQTSLADVAKQFTYFDEKTKSFKINRQGVLTLKEMELSAGLAQGTLTKMGLAASELDARLSEVSLAGLKFDNEEDKQYLANIAKIGAGGTYEVKLKDGTVKELRSLNQEEFNTLIDEQKKGPQTLEEISRSQLNLDEMMKNDIEAIKNKIVYGLTSARPALEAGEIARSITSAFGGGASGRGVADVETIRKYPEKLFAGVDKLITQIKEGKSSEDSLKSFLQENQNIMSLMGDDFKKGFGTYTDKVIGQLSDSNVVEKKIKETMSSFKTEFAASEMKLASMKPGESLIKGMAPVSSPGSTASTGGLPTQKVEHDFKPLVLDWSKGSPLTPENQERFNKMFSDSANSSRFKAYIDALFNLKSNDLSTTTVNY